MSTVQPAPVLGWAPWGVAHRRSSALLALVAVTVVVAGLSVAPRVLSPSAPAPAAPEAARALSSLPLSFEPNVGQAPDGVAFVARVGGATLSLSPTAATLAGPAGGVRLALVGSNPDAAMAGVEPRPGRVNYLRGDDPQKWRTNVETFAKVHYTGVYPGIDLVHYGNGGELEYDFVVAPGADPSLIAMQSDAPARIEDNGDLLIGTGDTALRQRRPVAYQELGGERRPVPAEFRMGRDGDVGFFLGNHDRRLPLVIDPLIYSSPLGGAGASREFALDIAVDAEGNAYVVGKTGSESFPTAGTPVQPILRGGDDAFVAKVNPAGSALLYSTYLGGSGDDVGHGIAVDASGNAYVTGQTRSNDYPAATFAGAIPGGEMAFVAKLAADGSALLYSKVLCTGGPSPDPSGFTHGTGKAVALDGTGNAYVTGECRTTPDYARILPTTADVFQPAHGDCCWDAFIAKIDSTGAALVYASWLGGSIEDSAQGIAIDGSGNAYVVGDTTSMDFPTSVGSFDTTKAASVDSFVTKVNASGNRVLYSSYLGGSSADYGRAIAVDDAGGAYVTGTTYSADFPTTLGASQPNNGGGADAFVTKLNPEGSALDYSTYFGGPLADDGWGIEVDNGGVAHLAGSTMSDGLPTVHPIFPFHRFGYDIFLAHLNSTGSALQFSTYLAHGRDGFPGGLALDAMGSDYVAAETEPRDLVTAGTPSPFQPSPASDSDAWVAKVTPGPPLPVPADLDGNRTTDVSVFRPATGTWYVQGGLTVGWGAGGDVAVPADYDGDATTDVAVFRPSTGTWFVLGGLTLAWGTSGDIAVPGDYDGNGSATPAVYRPSTGTWFVYNGATTAWGTTGDIPVPGDYDGDGDTDIAVYRPSTATWYVQGGATTTWGTSGDIPVPGDYDGDGETDIAVFRPSTGTWFVAGGATTNWGTSGDIPVPGDYDGDGHTDIAVFRPGDGTWYVQGGTTTTWGTATDLPLPLPAAIRQAFFA